MGLSRPKERRLEMKSANSPDNEALGDLVRSIQRHRAGAAKFFKPVCVIAAVDLANDGLLNPNDIDGDAIIGRFGDYVNPFFPERDKDGWQPLWHLTNDASGRSGEVQSH